MVVCIENGFMSVCHDSFFGLLLRNKNPLSLFVVGGFLFKPNFSIFVLIFKKVKLQHEEHLPVFLIKKKSKKDNTL
jgi:hypothetical protein